MSAKPGAPNQASEPARRAAPGHPVAAASAPDSPEAVLAQVDAALASGDPGRIANAHAVLRRALGRLLHVVASGPEEAIGPVAPSAPPHAAAQDAASGRAQAHEGRAYEVGDAICTTPLIY